MSHDLGMCCGTLCNKAGNLAYVDQLEKQTRLMRQTLIAIHRSVGDAELKLKPTELLQRIENSYRMQSSEVAATTSNGSEISTVIHPTTQLSLRRMP